MRKEYTVSYRRAPGTSPFAAWRKRRPPQVRPFIRLSGKWLARLGFPIGAKIEVEAEPGRLVLKAVSAYRSAELASELCEPEGEGAEGSGREAPLTPALSPAGGEGGG